MNQLIFFLFREEKEKIIKTQKEIFEELQIVASLSAEAPVHPSFQKRLLDFDDEEIIQSSNLFLSKFLNILVIFLNLK